MSKKTLSPLVDVLKVLGHPVRLRVLSLLRDGELRATQITDILGVAPYTALEHLHELERAGLLAEHAEGTGILFGLKPLEGLEILLDALWASLAGIDQIRRDRETAREVRDGRMALFPS